MLGKMDKSLNLDQCAQMCMLMCDRDPTNEDAFFVAIAHIRSQQIRNIQLRGHHRPDGTHIHKPKLLLRMLGDFQLRFSQTCANHA